MHDINCELNVSWGILKTRKYPFLLVYFIGLSFKVIILFSSKFINLEKSLDKNTSLSKL